MIMSADGIDQFYKQNDKKVENELPLIFSVPPHESEIKEDTRMTDRERLKEKLRLILKR